MTDYATFGVDSVAIRVRYLMIRKVVRFSNLRFSDGDNSVYFAV